MGWDRAKSWGEGAGGEKVLRCLYVSYFSHFEQTVEFWMYFLDTVGWTHNPVCDTCRELLRFKSFREFRHG